MIGKALALALLLLPFPLPAEELPAPAEPAAPAGVPLSLSDATARALANNNDIAIERESFRIVDASLLRADAPYDPTFRLDARYRNHTDPANSLLSGAPPNELSPSSEGYSGAVSIGALLPTGGTVSLSASAARDLTNNFLVLLSPCCSRAEPLACPRRRRAISRTTSSLCFRPRTAPRWASTSASRSFRTSRWIPPAARSASRASTGSAARPR